MGNDRLETLCEEFSSLSEGEKDSILKLSESLVSTGFIKNIDRQNEKISLLDSAALKKRSHHENKD